MTFVATESRELHFYEQSFSLMRVKKFSISDVYVNLISGRQVYI